QRMVTHLLSTISQPGHILHVSSGADPWAGVPRHDVQYSSDAGQPNRELPMLIQSSMWSFIGLRYGILVAVMIMITACGTIAQDSQPQPDVPVQTPPSCADGVRNGDETDVDCGGKCSACAADAKCAVDRDCASLRCSANQCSPSCEIDGLVAYFPFDGDTVD